MPQDQKSETMGFFDHLDELRVRFVRCLVVFLVGFGLCYFLVNEWVMEFLKAPLFEILPEGKRELYFTHLFESFLTHLKISAYSAIVLLSPFFFYQLWAFIVPGLYENERKLVVPFVFFATAFFVGGSAFAYYVLFPVGFKFFVTFGTPSDVALLTIGNYYGTVLKLLLLFGIAFELPVLVVFLGTLGVIDAPFLRKNRRHAIIGIAAISAVTAPPDAISMIILMIPLYLFYEGTILVVDALGVRRAKRLKRKEDLSRSPATSSGQGPADGESR